jgi:hypothetical protein
MPLVYLSGTYKGTSLLQLVGSQPRIVMRCTYGLDTSYQVRGADTVIPSLAGRVARNRVRDIRRVVLEGFVAGTGANDAAMLDDFRDACEELRTLFSPVASTGTLVINLEDGVRTATLASVRTLPEEPEWGPDDIPGFRTLAVELEAVGADWVIA